MIARTSVFAVCLFLFVSAAPAQSGQELLPQRISNFSFGAGVAIKGNVAAISGGALVRHPTFNSDVPSIDMYRYNGSSWEFESNLISNDNVFWNKIGGSVHLESGRILIGTPATAHGAVLEFLSDGAAWDEQERIESTSTTSLSDNFGAFVSLRDSVLVVGDNDDWDGFVQRQIAYIFRLEGGQWQIEDTLSTGLSNVDIGYGVSVAASKTVAVVGAPFYSVGDVVTREGAAFVYEFDGANWNEVQMLTAGDFTLADARFGQTVATDGTTIVIGAVRDMEADLTHAGAAYVFEKEAGAWTQKQRLVAGTPEAYANFGLSSALDGDKLIVGAPSDTRFENSGGAAYFFMNNGAQWTERSRMALPDSVEGDRFGTSVALDGEWVIVGAPGRREGQWKPGAAYIFPMSTLVSVEKPGGFEAAGKLMQPYPNPFVSRTTIEFELDKAEMAHLNVYDMLGRHVETLVSSTLAPGRHTFDWNRKDRPAGVYFARLQTGRSFETKKLILLKE